MTGRNTAAAIVLWTAAATLGLGAATVQAGGGKGRTLRAVAEIEGCTDGFIGGTAKLVEQPSEEGIKRVKITMHVKGLSAGKHGVHIHQTAACTPTCGAAGGHFDPGPNSNTSPDGNHPFHAGDLVNMVVHGGVGVMQTVTTRVTLSPGPLSLFDADGSAFIVHVDPDTYCPEGAVAGCAGGGRAACGIIEAVERD